MLVFLVSHGSNEYTIMNERQQKRIKIAKQALRYNTTHPRSRHGRHN